MQEASYFRGNHTCLHSLPASAGPAPMVTGVTIPPQGPFHTPSFWPGFRGPGSGLHIIGGGRPLKACGDIRL